MQNLALFCELDQLGKEIPGFDQVLEQEIAGLRKFHLEDVEVCTAVQRGLRSSVYSPGPLGHLEMPIWLFTTVSSAANSGGKQLIKLLMLRSKAESKGEDAAETMENQDARF